MGIEETLEKRFARLERQLRQWKRIATVCGGLAILISLIGAARAQDRVRRIDTDTLYVRTIYLQDENGKLRGTLGSGLVGGPKFELLDEAGKQRVALSAETDVSTLYLSAGNPGPTVSVWASNKALLPTGVSISDRTGKSRISAEIAPGDMDSLASVQLRTKDDKLAVYLSSADWGGNVTVSSTQGSIDLSSDPSDANATQTESRLGIWQSAGAGRRAQRIRVGMVNGEPKIEILRPAIPPNRQARK